jgi:hypothetical protein
MAIVFNDPEGKVSPSAIVGDFVPSEHLSRAIVIMYGVWGLEAVKVYKYTGSRCICRSAPTVSMAECICHKFRNEFVTMYHTLEQFSNIVNYILRSRSGKGEVPKFHIL